MRNFTVKSTTNPYKRFRNKKTRLAVHDVKKLCKNHYSKTRRENRIATKRGAPYSHIAISHSLFLVCIGVVGAIVKKLINFSEGNRKQTQIHIWLGTVSTLQLCKKNPKTDWKTRCWSTSKNSANRIVKTVSMKTFAKKLSYQNSYKRLGPEESQKS